MIDHNTNTVKSTLSRGYLVL